MESRRFDGKPETTKDTKFFDLRASGYTGPIDQDGNAVHSLYAMGVPGSGKGAGSLNLPSEQTD